MDNSEVNIRKNRSWTFENLEPVCQSQTNYFRHWTLTIYTPGPYLQSSLKWYYPYGPTRLNCFSGRKNFKRTQNFKLDEFLMNFKSPKEKKLRVY